MSSCAWKRIGPSVLTRQPRESSTHSHRRGNRKTCWQASHLLLTTYLFQCLSSRKSKAHVHPDLSLIPLSKCNTQKITRFFYVITKSDKITWKSSSYPRDYTIGKTRPTDGTTAMTMRRSKFSQIHHLETYFRWFVQTTKKNLQLWSNDKLLFFLLGFPIRFWSGLGWSKCWRFDLIKSSQSSLESPELLNFLPTCIWRENLSNQTKEMKSRIMKHANPIKQFYGFIDFFIHQFNRIW